jgi:sigma-E factor negative regulatory protein RseA
MQAVESSVPSVPSVHLVHMERVSGLMDGELAGDEAVREIARLKASGDAPDDNAASREAWETYHLIGDVIRDGGAAVPPLSAGFSARFSARLAQEPTVLAPRALAAAAPAKSRFQTYALSAAASVAAVTVVGWMALSNISSKPTPGDELATAAASAAQPQVAGLPPQAAAALVAAAKPAPEHVHEYLLAHQGISPSTAFQGVAPYVRTVSAAGN